MALMNEKRLKIWSKKSAYFRAIFELKKVHMIKDSSLAKSSIKIGFVAFYAFLEQNKKSISLKSTKEASFGTCKRLKRK